MKRVYYFLKGLKKEFTTAVIGIVGVVFTWKFGDTLAVQQGVSLVVVVVTLFIIIYLRSKERDFTFSALTRRKDKDSWVGHGVFQFARVQNAYEITNAEPGYIHSHILTWSDYKLIFDFKLAKYGLGVVIRAVNLANYVMLQITQSGIRPHIRINGGWRIWEDAEAGLVFDNKLEFGTWYQCEIYCDKGTITIKMFSNRKKFFERFWNVPKGSVVFKFKKDENDEGTDIPFPITLEYGSIGFRQSGDEKAFVKNVLVEKI